MTKHLLLAATTLTLISLQAATLTKSATGTDLADAASWGGTAPTNADPAILNWTSTSLGSGLTLGTAATWYGMNIQGSADTAVGLSGTGTITLGSGGIKVESTGVNTTIANAITLGSVQTWSAATGKTLTVSGVVSGSAPLIIGAASQTSQTFLTGTAQTLFTNVNLSDVIATGGIMGGTYVAGNNNLLGGGYLLSADKSNYWLESQDGTLVKGVKVALAQNGANISATATAAKYATGSLGYDFNAGGNGGTLATTDSANGYGAHTTTLITKSADYAGTVTLGGNNTFSGGLTVAGGTLIGTIGTGNVNIAQAGAFGTGSITVNSGATITATAVFTLGGGNITTRVVNLNGGTMDIKAASTGGEYFRTINMTGGTILTSDGGSGGDTSDWFRTTGAGLAINTLAAATSSTISTRFDLTYGHATVDVADGAATDDLVISGNITQNTGAGSGARNFTKTGAGKLTFSGTAYYTGTTLISGGTLNVTGSLADTGAVTVNGAGATYTVGASDTVGTVTLTAGTINGDFTLTGSAYEVAAGTIAAKLAGTGSMTKTTAGTVVISGDNSGYSGAISANAGSLLVNGTLSSGSNVSVANAGTVLGGTGTINGAITIAPGAILQGGDGTTTGALKAGGNVTLQSGSIIRLAVGNSATTHSTLTRTGGTWVFDANQQFTLIDAGAIVGTTYTGLITGLTGNEAGLNTIGSWTTTNGWSGRFELNGSSIDYVLTAIPEPATCGLLGAGALAGITLVRRRRRA